MVRRCNLMLMCGIVLTGLIYVVYPVSKGGYSLTAETSAAREVLLKTHRAEARCLSETGRYQPLEMLSPAGCGGADGISSAVMHGYKISIAIDESRFTATAVREGSSERIRFVISEDGEFRRVVD